VGDHLSLHSITEMLHGNRAKPDFIFCLAKDFIPFAPIGKNSHPLENSATNGKIQPPIGKWTKNGLLSADF